MPSVGYLAQYSCGFGTCAIPNRAEPTLVSMLLSLACASTTSETTVHSAGFELSRRFFPKVTMKRSLRATLAAAVVWVLAGSSIILAQAGGRSGQPPSPTGEAPARHWYSVNIVTVKPESANDFIEFQRSQTIPMLQRGGVKSRDVWQSGAPFGEGGMYAIVTPIDKFEEYDLDPRALRVLGQEAGRAYQEKNRRMLSSSRSFAIQDRAELSVQPVSSFKPKAGILTLTTVVSGHAADYEAYLKTNLLPVLKRGKVGGYLVSRTIFGGDANEYGTMQLIDSYAEIDKGPLTTQVLGPAAAQELNAKAFPHIASQHRELVRYVPNLSFGVATSTQVR
jgi:hypothetical protein